MFMNRKSTLSKAYKHLKNTPEGRLIFEDILKFSGYNNPSYVDGKPDRTAYNEGLKAYARRVLTLMNFSEADSEQMKKMIRKNINLKNK